VSRRRLLITGASGFVGSWCVRSSPSLPDWTPITTNAAFDLRDPESIRASLGSEPPEAVLHLAAQTFVPAAFSDPRATLEVNLLGTLSLLQALSNIGFRGRFVFVSSADVYGQVPESRMPIDEEVPPLPRNPYAVSKLAAEALCRQRAISDSLDAVVVRPFNHIGPGQNPRFVVSGLARQFVRIRRGLQPPKITAGDLDVSRDFTDVRDVVQAYYALLSQGVPGGTYQVCSGRATTLREVFALLEAIVGVSPSVEVDPTLIRPNEQRVVAGSFERLASCTGWRPRIELRKSLEDICAYWDERIENEPS